MNNGIMMKAERQTKVSLDHIIYGRSNTKWRCRSEFIKLKNQRTKTTVANSSLFRARILEHKHRVVLLLLHPR
jgi:hypothetical protein